MKKALVFSLAGMAIVCFAAFQSAPVTGETAGHALVRVYQTWRPGDNNFVVTTYPDGSSVRLFLPAGNRWRPEEISRTDSVIVRALDEVYRAGYRFSSHEMVGEVGELVISTFVFVRE
jgi:hypothetical protein